MSSPRFPEPPAPIAPTPVDALNAAVERVAAQKDAWTSVSIPDRIRLLERCIEGLVWASEAWVADACRAKGIAADDSLAGEEWISGPSTTIRNARLLVRSLESLGQRRPPKVRARDDGQLVATVFPADGFERALFAGVRCEVWIEPGRPATQGRIYREPSGPGKVALVLGAGNVSSIAPMDAFYKLFVENEVVVLKTNPVNAYLGPHWERALAPLIDAGFLAIVHGGGQEGAYLAEHPRIDTLHVTGSDKTYDAIVWGSSADEQSRRKSAHDPKNKRPFTAELGVRDPCARRPRPVVGGGPGLPGAAGRRDGRAERKLQPAPRRRCSSWRRDGSRGRRSSAKWRSCSGGPLRARRTTPARRIAGAGSSTSYPQARRALARRGAGRRRNRPLDAHPRRGRPERGEYALSNAKRSAASWPRSPWTPTGR